MSHFRTFVVLALIGLHTVSACDDKIDISAGKRLANGDIEYDGVVYERGDFSVEQTTRTTNACVKPVSSKCCPLGKGAAGKSCLNTSVPFDTSVWNEYHVIEGTRARKMFRFKIGKVNCTPPYVRIMVSDLADDKEMENWHLRSDGKLLVKLPNKIPPWTVLDSDKYCIDSFISEENNGITQSRLEALACFLNESEEKHYEIRSACMLISCVFILLTLMVYAWLPELRNIHGRVLMAYLICLLVGFMCMASMQIMLTIDSIVRSVCTTLTIIIYFALQSAFFWLNVMSFDIWWTFSGKGGMAMRKVSNRFFAYSLYAFGVPTIFTIILVSLEFSGLRPHPLLPRLRDQGCFLSGNSKLLYLYSPMFILCLANIVFFVMTAIKIAKIKKETAVLHSIESAKHDQHKKDKQRLLLYVKLFAVMGINWILEVISALYPEAGYIWNVTDAYNVLIGVIIFIIFVCKRKIYDLVKKRYRQLNGKQMSHSQTLSTRTMSSRDDVKMSSIKY